ncbi:MAG: rhodanese-like domain-containing protein [Polyangiales bacterium]
MTIRRVSPQEAHTLMTEEGYLYLDVRSVPEFEGGHPTGAYNVPLLHSGAGGMQSNPDFLAVVEARFPKDSKLVVGCRAGSRSLKAVEQLQAAGYSALVDQRAGYAGARSPFGGLQEPGWSPAGLPVSTEALEGRTYGALKTAAGK